MATIDIGVNTMTFEQTSAVLTEIVSQASGQKQIAPVDTSSFISVAQTGLLTGVDPIIGAISQVISRTIFSIRPYYRKFAGLYADSIRYGNHVRKLQVVDGQIYDDQGFLVCKPDGDMDMYKAECPKVLQTNFYGGDVYQIPLKIFRNQLNSAFTGPEEFARFITMLMTNISDRLEQIRENTARAAITNFIAGKIEGDDDNVIHCLTEYNTATGAGLTATSVYDPNNFPAFVRWLYARVNQVSDMLTERSYKYHINITGSEIQRHTPKARQKVYISSMLINQVDALVRTVNFDNSFMRLADFEKVGFWQAIDSPLSINVTPVYMDTTGDLVKGSAIAQSNIIGVIFDEEAVGYTEIDRDVGTTPYNPKGRFSVMWWNVAERYWNDFTENGVVFVLD